MSSSIPRESCKATFRAFDFNCNVGRLEKDLRIRKSGAAHPVTHKADLFVGTQVRHGVFGDPPPQPSEDLDKDPRSNAVLGSPATDELELMVFAVEFKKKRGANNQNQLIYSLSSGQSQRKALGLVNKPLFGAVCADGIFKLYASWWNQVRASSVMQYRMKLVLMTELHRKQKSASQSVPAVI